MSPLIVGIICILIFLAIIAWDIFLYRDKIDRNSISQVIIDASKKTPFVPFILGFGMGLLAGHLFA